MREGWVETTLGELTTQIRDSVKVEPGQNYTLLGVSGKGKGAFIKEAVTSETSKAKSFYRAIPGQFIYNRLFAGNGSFGIVPDSNVELFVSNEFPLFNADPRKLETDYLRLTFEDPSMWAHVELQCVGSTGSRMRWTEDKFGATTIALPPLEEQRRIVDVIESVDTYIAALEKRAETARTARSALLHDLLSHPGPDWVETTLGDACVIYQPETISKDLMSDDAEFIVYGANGPIGRYERFNHAEGEVVVTCRGATCGVVNMTPPRCWITGNAMVFQPIDDLLSKRFLYWALHSSIDVSVAISGSAQPQITRAGVSPTKFRLPPRRFQDLVVELVDDISFVIDALAESRKSVLILRSALLSDLLSGNHEIPASYDELLGAA